MTKLSLCRKAAITLLLSAAMLGAADDSIKLEDTDKLAIREAQLAVAQAEAAALPYTFALEQAKAAMQKAVVGVLDKRLPADADKTEWQFTPDLLLQKKPQQPKQQSAPPAEPE